MSFRASRIIWPFVAMVLIACSNARNPPAVVRAEVLPRMIYPSDLGPPHRVCEPIGTLPSPDGRWIAFLRRGEWDFPGFQIPYLLTELWIVERGSGVTRRALDFNCLSHDWASRFSLGSHVFGRAGGFTFREMSWSPDSRAIALEDAGDEWEFRGTVIVDVVTGRILELAGDALEWSPDGSRALLCKGLGLGCRDGLLLVHIDSGDAREILAGVEVMDGGWQSSVSLAVLGYVQKEGRSGWWEYNVERPDASLRPIERPRIICPPPPMVTWRAPEPGERLPCRTSGREAAVVELVGTLKSEPSSYAPPHYGQKPDRDTKLEALVLVLDKPISVAANVLGFVGNELERRDAREVQLILSVKEREYRTLMNQRVAVSGWLTLRTYACHRRDILMYVDDIRAADR